MPAPTYTYRQPGPTLVSVAPTGAPPNVAQGNTVVVLGTFPKGPRVPTIVDAATAAQWFGAATDPASTGFKGPIAVAKMAAQVNSDGNIPCSYLICRVGVACASANVAASSGNAFVLTAVGRYAGTFGTKLAYTVEVGSGAVASLTFYDMSSGTGRIIKQYVQGRDDLSSNLAIVNTINGDNTEINLFGPSQAIVTASTPGATYPPTAVATATAFTGGNDGAAATPTDPTISGDATHASLLDQSLQFTAQYITALFDEALIVSAIQTHQTAAANKLQYRMAYLGPEIGATFTSLSGTYFTGTASSQVVGVAHDAYTTTNPVSGRPLVVAGYVFAAAACALKANGPPQSTTTRQIVRGFTTVSVAPDKTGPLSQTDQISLAVTSTGNGQMVTAQDPVSGGVQIIHGLTTAPRQQNGALNAMSEINAQATDNAHNQMMITAAQSTIGKAFKSPTAQQSTVLTLLNSGASALDNAGTINTYSYTPARDPTTGQLVVNATYGLPVANNYILFQSGGVVLQS